MQRVTLRTRLETITETKSLDKTEDSYIACDDGRQITLVVADGAPQRLKTSASMRPMLDGYGEGTATGRYAALIIRETAAELSVKGAPLRDFALEANRRLRDRLKAVYGEITSEAVIKLEPDLTVLAEDPRFVRWVLPASCITAARYDTRTRRLSYAHGGDTGLFLLKRDGSTVHLTPDQMRQHDDRARAEVARIRAETGLTHWENLRTEAFASAWEIDRYNGIYHNYEGPNGETDEAVGVGVVNGLPQLEAYIVEGEIDTDDLDAIVLCSDGFFWPAPLDETPEQAQERLQMMGELLRTRGLHGYLQALRAEEMRDSRDNMGARYLHFILDDATALMLHFDHET